MSRSPISAPSFPYRGGKARLRRFVVRWLPLNGRIFCEPFAGRANVFFLMERIAKFDTWVLNDLQTIPWIEAVGRYAGEVLPTIEKDAAREFLLSRTDESYWLEPLITWAGGLPDKSSVTGTRGHKLDDYALKLAGAASAVSRAVLEKRDAVDILQFLGPEDFAYIDPPYQNSNVGSYLEGMVDRKRMISVLVNAKFKWALSEYPSPDMQEAFGDPIASYSGVFVNPSPSSKEPARRVTEVLYSNYTMNPNIIDFEDSERPFKSTLAMFDEHPVLSNEMFQNYAPENWGEGTRKAQWNRLTCLPFAWFDGRVITNLLKCPTGKSDENATLKVDLPD